MKRAAWLAAMVLILAPGPGSGQTVTGGLRTVGAFGGDDQSENVRSVRLEMEGGQKLEGTIRFRPVIVDGDLGRYRIRPDKIKRIQFLRRADVGDGEPPEAPPNAPAMRNRAGMMGGMMPAALVRGKVVTTSDAVIIGDVHIPPDFALELDFGTLTVAPEKLRVLTMIEPAPAEAPAAGEPPAAKPPAGGSARPQKPRGPDPGHP